MDLSPSRLSQDRTWAVFLDLDDTLMAENHVIPPENCRAIARARAMGHRVFLNTGRSFAHVPPEVAQQVELDGIITGNGAMVMLDGQVRHEAAMPPQLVGRMMEYILDHGGLWALFEGYRGTYAISTEPEKRKPHQIPITSPRDLSLIYPHDRIQVAAVGRTVPEEFIRLFREELTVVQADTFADVCLRGNNKAAGMERALSLIGIPRERTIAMGDSCNDAEMLDYAHIGVAVANARRELLDKADHITAANTAAGVALALEKFLF